MYFFEYSIQSFENKKADKSAFCVECSRLVTYFACIRAHNGFYIIEISYHI